MTNSPEFFAPTVEEAVAKAADVLGIARSELDFKILDRGSAGFLGLGARDARIMVKEPLLEASKGLTTEEEDPPVSDDREGISPMKGLNSGGPHAEEPEKSGVKPPHELIVAVDEFVTTLVTSMGFDGTVDAYDAGDSIVVDVTTKETGLFIGQKGETIDSIQYLLNVAIYKERPFLKRIVVDCQGYRRRRVEAIQGMAHRAARRAIREGRARSLPPMPASERRVVHLFLKENPEVTTYSDGQAEERRVIVAPL